MNKNNLKKLPLGISDFKKIIKGKQIYVDKTQFIYQMITSGDYYFLSRPRRFGKSLLVSTLEALFSGNKDLFKDLWIAKSDWSWSTHPVIKIDFSRIDYSSVARLEKSIAKCLRTIAKRYKVSLEKTESIKDLFGELIDKLALKNSVVLLVDEYDKPILDHIDNVAEAKAQREVLKNFYSVIKSVDQSLQFVLLTGVSKFAKTSVFSGINNLEDISLDRTYAALLGYTNEELVHYFSSHIQRFADESNKAPNEIIDQLRITYDGYQFTKEKILVFNPYSVLTSLKKHEFDDYWFETGTPTFLFKLLQKKDYRPEDILAPTLNKQNLESFEPDNIPLPALLFQTGYLTVKSYDQKNNSYTLGIPNREVNSGLTVNLADTFTQLSSNESNEYARIIAQSLENKNMIELQKKLQEFFNRMPYTVHVTDESKLQFVLYSPAERDVV